MRTKLLLITLLTVILPDNVSAFSIKDRLSIRLGASYSLTQLGISPFSETRRWYDRGIASPNIGLEYSIPLNGNELSIGVQVIEKGFKTSLKSPPSNTFEYEESYEYHLTYVELPICYRIIKPKFSYLIGGYFSYLFDDTYRYNNTSVVKTSPPKYNDFFFSEQYPHPERLKSYDGGILLGISKKITSSLEIDMIIQKGLIQIDNRNSVDLGYNLSGLVCLRYRFLSAR